MAIGFDLDDKALRRSDKSHRLIDLGQSSFGIDRPLRHAPADAFHLCVVDAPGKRIEHKLYRAASLDILQGVLAKVGVDPDVGGIDQGQSGLTGVNILPVGKLQSRLSIPGSTLSHHLKTLIIVGLVSQEREATTLICHANYPVMRGLVEFLVAECCTEADCATIRQQADTAA